MTPRVRLLKPLVTFGCRYPEGDDFRADQAYEDHHGHRLLTLYDDTGRQVCTGLAAEGAQCLDCGLNMIDCRCGGGE